MNDLTDRGPLPSYDNPPVVETVLGVQFDRFSGFKNGHLGAYWKSLPTDEWSTVADAPPLEPQFERFEPSARWARGLHIQLTRDPASRLQITSTDGDRMMGYKFSVIEWGRDPDRFTDEGVEAPDAKILGLAIDVAERFRDQGYPAPDSVVPDPNGGIVFQRRENGSSEVVQIWDDGTIRNEPGIRHRFYAGRGRRDGSLLDVGGRRLVRFGCADQRTGRRRLAESAESVRRERGRPCHSARRLAADQLHQLHQQRRAATRRRCWRR